MQLLVLVTGPPASGKTTLARSLAPLLRLPLLSKDAFKEELHGAPVPEGVSQRQWSRRLSDAAWDTLFLKASSMSGAVVEGNIPRERSATVLTLHPRPVEVFCRVPKEVLVERLSGRSGRHPVHDDGAVIEEVLRGEARGSGPLNIGPLIEVRTDQPVDMEWLATTAREI